MIMKNGLRVQSAERRPEPLQQKDLLSIYQYRNFDNYKLNYWTVTINDETYLILFGWKSASERLLTYIESQEPSSLPFLNIKEHG